LGLRLLLRLRRLLGPLQRLQRLLLLGACLVAAAHLLGLVRDLLLLLLVLRRLGRGRLPGQLLGLVGRLGLPLRQAVGAVGAGLAAFHRAGQPVERLRRLLHLAAGLRRRRVTLRRPIRLARRLFGLGLALRGLRRLQVLGVLGDLLLLLRQLLLLLRRGP